MLDIVRTVRQRGHKGMQDHIKRTLGNVIPVSGLLLAALEEVGHGVRGRVAVIRVDLETCAVAEVNVKVSQLRADSI